MASLSEADKFYIENNRKVSLDKLMDALKKSKELIKAYLLVLEQKEHIGKKKKGESPLFKEIHRKRGAVALTREATELSEEIERQERMNPSATENRHRGVHGKDIIKARKD